MIFKGFYIYVLTTSGSITRFYIYKSRKTNRIKKKWKTLTDYRPHTDSKEMRSQKWLIAEMKYYRNKLYSALVTNPCSDVDRFKEHYLETPLITVNNEKGM